LEKFGEKFGARHYFAISPARPTSASALAARPRKRAAPAFELAQVVNQKVAEKGA
jgi:hypothetical protein